MKGSVVRILLVEDDKMIGEAVLDFLRADGYAVDWVQDGEMAETALRTQTYDLVLLEVTGEHAVEPAVVAALRVKRANAKQFVGYLADASLETSGLAGDAVLPRNATKVPEALRRFIADEN